MSALVLAAVKPGGKVGTVCSSIQIAACPIVSESGYRRVQFIDDVGVTYRGDEKLSGAAPLPASVAPRAFCLESIFPGDCRSGKLMILSAPKSHA